MNEQTLSIEVGNRLKMLRHSLDLSQAEFAEKVDRTQREISNWEKGKKLIPLLILFRIKELYKVPIGYFDPDDNSHFEKVFAKN